MSDKQESPMYANGMSKGSCKKISIFYFGIFFKQVDVDRKNRMFNIILYKEVVDATGKEHKFEENFTDEFLEHFKNSWGTTPGFKLIFYIPEEL